ncbi:4-aminobutyrate--2-oxoglutarate transaminase [Pseudoclavibacter chungangensis]|uniref:(S)-3-amino-2-methylpropionate transaminase n=1 Tax=Pseudoclavibacter chungangensis TaxID=587635 RepID=A0A7J5BPJ3_9MICO|nr:4-aminobutyrate--2-oxoglutarate transaminase [Pseudoclavibacter chungangensis]KAB1652307.1 4-aminobutyrate--2-oxoglutarate transaminase [Pseudoclavibacter chungangensis]NYJ66910.1 4-aminobutyrate aminotransferase/(S)-3-amino-2-methylpropionate transaminase [Pseudoclavibacter chungangensis]
MSSTITTGAAPSAPQLVTEIPGPRSREINARRTAAVPRGVGAVLPVYVDRAEGPWVVDVDGNRLLDLGAGIGVTTLGHSQPTVVAAAQEQLERFAHTLFTVTPYENYVRLAERLAARTPGSHAKKSFFVNSGAEAVENAVKIARAHTGRYAVASLDHAFHGRTNLTIAMNHRAAPYGTGFGPFAPGIHRVPNSYPFRDGLTGAEAAARTIAHLEQRIGVTDLAAIVAEPIQGEGGFVVPADGYLPALQAWASANGVVFVADEIQAGLGRTGTWFASELFDLVPDLVLTAKGIADGLPLAGITGRAEIMDAALPGGLGGTFGGNPVSIAAAHAVFDLLETGAPFVEAARIEHALTTGLRALAARHDVIGEVRGHGAMIAFELTEPGTTAPLAGLANEIAAFAAQRGILLLTAGSDGNVIRFLPSLEVTDEQIAFTLGVVDDALAAR